MDHGRYLIYCGFSYDFVCIDLFVDLVDGGFYLSISVLNLY